MSTELFVSAVIVAAGSATRMQGVDKQRYKLLNRPVLLYSLDAFSQCSTVKELVVVCKQEDASDYQALLEQQNYPIPFHIVCGGKQRQDSVFAGVRACSSQTTHYAIHDGARPLITPDQINQCIALAEQNKAAAVGVAVKDTIKIVNQQEQILSTPDRNTLRAIQTPQIFQKQLYLQAMQQAVSSQQQYTDDCQLVESIGHPVWVSQGNYSNLKITTPDDLVLVKALLLSQKGEQ